MSFTFAIKKDSPEASCEVAHAWSKNGIGKVVGSTRDELAFKIPAVDAARLRIP